MYITITAQKLGDNYSQSVSDFVTYLEKENENKSKNKIEHFFNQYGEHISSKEVINEIDSNTSKLKKSEPKFYSITLNPSQYELKHLNYNSEALKEYTKEVMKMYALSFNREIEGKPITISDIKYYAKIEYKRSYKGTDKAIRENSSFNKKIVQLKNEIQQIKSGKLNGNIENKLHQIKQLELEAPNKIQGKMIKQGMLKEGSQLHIHIIVSRKDTSNRFSLSPGSKYKASEVKMNGKIVKRGFNRDQFFTNSEKVFDNLFNYKRNYVETYTARKVFIKNPKKYYASIIGLPTSEKSVAFKLLGKMNLNNAPLMSVPTNKLQLMLKAAKRIKHGVSKAIQSGSIGV